MSAFARRVNVPVRNGLSGRGFISGQGEGLVTVAGAAASRPVVVFDKKTLLPVIQVSSAEDGTYLARGLDPNRKFVVVAFDSSGQFNAVIRDNITPAPMA